MTRHTMHRRSFLTLLGASAAAWPLAARAQQRTMPVVGYLRSGSRAASAQIEATFRQGLGSMGFEEGRNIAIDYRYAEIQDHRLPALAAELVHRRVAVMYAADNLSAVTLKAATSTIPIVFRIGGDPIHLGLVPSLNRPGGNLTGVSFLATATEAIRLQMLHEAVPKAVVMGLLVNATNPNSDQNTRESQEAARKLGLELHVVSATSAQEIDTAFAMFVQRRTEALVINGDSLFSGRRQQLAVMTARHGMPAISTVRDFPDAGGLMSYGANNVDADRLGGVYVGRVLKGDKPADLPVQQSVKVELILNMITAKALGVTFPLTLLGRADEVIE
jgi:putative ABC transport system substrate-binding protein